MAGVRGSQPVGGLSALGQRRRSAGDDGRCPVLIRPNAPRSCSGRNSGNSGVNFSFRSPSSARAASVMSIASGNMLLSILFSFSSTPMRRPGWKPASVRRSRRLATAVRGGTAEPCSCSLDFRYGSKADVNDPSPNVCFAPESGHSAASQSMSALCHERTSVTCNVRRASGPATFERPL